MNARANAAITATYRSLTGIAGKKREAMIGFPSNAQAACISAVLATAGMRALSDGNQRSLSERMGDSNHRYETAATAMLEQNRRMHDHRATLGVEHGYAEHPGGHTWDYWADHLEDHVRFHNRAGGALA